MAQSAPYLALTVDWWCRWAKIQPVYSALAAALRRYWVPVDGAIPVCHEGCAVRDWLVVSGPEAGRVWHDATADMKGWSPWTPTRLRPCS